jgi:2-polyprenyl-3-methyl-5-hydroxy-6-metoxy-1,4-benzoquinol methylase
MFGPRFAAHQARRYRRRGLDATEQRIVDFLDGAGIEGATILEIGGGAGQIQLELLRRGAASATNLELVDTYDTQAVQLAAQAGMTDRINRRIVDIAATPDEVTPADVVVLHRVVCCYPDYERLLAAAADHTKSLLVVSHPPRNPVSRFLVASQNAFFRLSGKSFRTFAHPPDRMMDVLRDHGLVTAYTHRGRLWHVAGLRRETGAGGQPKTS